MGKCLKNRDRPACPSPTYFFFSNKLKSDKISRERVAWKKHSIHKRIGDLGIRSGSGGRRNLGGVLYVPESGRFQHPQRYTALHLSQVAKHHLSSL